MTSKIIMSPDETNGMLVGGFSYIINRSKILMWFLIHFSYFQCIKGG